MASKAKCSPEVAELTAIAVIPVPIKSANLVSNSFTFGPEVTHPDLRVLITSAISSFLLYQVLNKEGICYSLK